MGAPTTARTPALVTRTPGASARRSLSSRSASGDRQRLPRHTTSTSKVSLTARSLPGLQAVETVSTSRGAMAIQRCRWSA